MYASRITSLVFAGVLAMVLPTAVQAQNCKAVGYTTENTVFEQGGIGSEGIRVYKDGNEIINYAPGEFDDPICQHTKDLDSELPYVVVFTSDCGSLFITGCEMSYADQIGLKGEIHDGGDFYGIGEVNTVQCGVMFNC